MSTKTLLTTKGPRCTQGPQYITPRQWKHSSRRSQGCRSFRRKEPLPTPEFSSDASFRPVFRGSHWRGRKKRPQYKEVIRAGGVLKRLRKTPHGEQEYEYLIVENAVGGYNSPPKGRVEPCDNGSFAACAMREIREETGFEVSLKDTDPYFDVTDTRYFVVEDGKYTYNPLITGVEEKNWWLTSYEISRLQKKNRGIHWLLKKYIPMHERSVALKLALGFQQGKRGNQ